MYCGGGRIKRLSGLPMASGGGVSEEAANVRLFVLYRVGGLFAYRYIAGAGNAGSVPLYMELAERYAVD